MHAQLRINYRKGVDAKASRRPIYAGCSTNSASNAMGSILQIVVLLEVALCVGFMSLSSRFLVPEPARRTAIAGPMVTSCVD